MLNERDRQTQSAHGVGVSASTGTDADEAGTGRNAANPETTLADRYGAGVEKAGVRALTICAKAVEAYRAAVGRPVDGDTMADRRASEGEREDAAKEAMWDVLYQLSPADLMTLASISPEPTHENGMGVEDAGAQHTPGPWHACKDGACTCKAVWCAGHPIADVTSGEWGDEYPAIRLDEEGIGAKAEAYMERTVYGSIDPAVAAANARLIAAAPELLEVVRDIVSDCNGVVNPGLYDLAVAALSKATLTTGGTHD